MDDKIKRVRELSAIDKDPRQFPPGSAQEHSRVAARWELLALAPDLADELEAARKEIAELRAQNGRLMHERNAIVNADELGRVSERLEQENWAADAHTVREAALELVALRARAEKAERERDEAFGMRATWQRIWDALEAPGGLDHALSKIECWKMDETRLADLERSREWQPIETAPKDGTWILCSSPHWGNMLIMQYDGRGWVRRPWGTRYVPTHWMPLPEPPKEAR